MANTCRAGRIVAEVETGERDAREAVEELMEGLPASLDPEECPPGDWLESCGWWCVFGAECALRHLGGGELQRVMGVFTGKLRDIADKMENWAFREFALRMEYAARRSIEAATGVRVPPSLDAEDLWALSGVMGRFPRFRPLGWEILRTAKVVSDG